MKKLIIGKSIENGSGTCDWCGENCGELGQVEAFKGNTVNVVFVYPKNDKRELCWMKKEEGWTFFGNRKFGEPDLYWVVNPTYDYETQTRKVTPLICKNCAKQLAK